MRIIVGGMVGQFPLGGVAWDYFHYVLAMHELGHDVYYHEDTNTWPYNPVLNQPSDDGIYNAQFIRDFFLKHAPALADKWHFCLLRDKSFGMSKDAFDAVARSADVYLNVSGVCLLPESLSPSCRRVFLDSDPGYNQMGLQDMLDAEGPTARRYVEVAKEHNVHLTYAENIHNADCRLPHAGINWITTRPVVTLPHWAKVRATIPAVDAPFTTVMTLDLSKEPKKLRYNGIDYFDKRPEFEKFITLPRRMPQIKFDLAIGQNKGLDPVRNNGWHVADSHAVSVNADTYCDFIARSAGEWSIAKNVYAATNSGWFSCRTCCYLAGGRPAVVQDTKWSRYIPSGSGLFAFDTMDECVAAMERVASDPVKQRNAAYEIAREYLAPDRVITPMLEAIFNSSPPLEGGVRGRGNSRQYTARISTARKLRRDTTGPEKVLWSRLRNKQLNGVRFRRQQLIGPFIVDFYCAEHKLVIELDGRSHFHTTLEDEERENYLREQGLRVLRFSNDEALREVEAVVNTIWEAISPLPPTLPSPSGGEGKK